MTAISATLNGHEGMALGFARLICRDPNQAVIEQDVAEDQTVELARIRREALEDAKQQVEAEVRQEQDRRRGMLAKLETELGAYLDNLEHEVSRQLVSYALELAEILVRHESTHAAMIRDIITDTIDPAAGTEGIRVRLCPADVEAITQDASSLSGDAVLSSIEFITDPALGPGDVTIDSPSGYFNGRISERVRILKERLAEQMGESGADDSMS